MKILLPAFACLFFCCSSSGSKKVVPEQVVVSDNRITGIIGDSAMVVTAHREATQVGFDILKQGGNAVDAAVAVQFALAVVYPNAGNIGGGGFMVWRNNNGETNTLDFREMAPAASTKNMFLDPGTAEVNREMIESSHLASGVPGSVDGMWTAHQKYGSMDWKKLLDPAIKLAIEGFPLTARQANELNAKQKDLKKLNKGKTYFINDNWKAGDTLIQKDLAKTLVRIQMEGRKGFYEGNVANLIVKEMTAHNGIITADDLKNYHAVWRAPVKGTYQGYEIISMPPPSSGGVALIQLLNAVENYQVKNSGHNTVETINLMTEAEKFVYADRSTWLGDPDFFKVPLSELTDKKYAQQRMQNFENGKVIPANQIAAGVFPGYESEETTHFSIVDAYGNAVAITTTLNDSYGSGIVVDGCGFILNNEMDDFSAKPGEPNLYGLIGGEANAIAPGKRMLSSMTPTIVVKDGQLFMVTGTPGGSTIITSVFQTILNVVDHDMTMQESINASRFHNQWLPDEILVERTGFNTEVIAGLKQMGYKIKDRDAIGRVDAILVRADKKLEGAADPRGDDWAMGW